METESDSMIEHDSPAETGLFGELVRAAKFSFLEAPQAPTCFTDTARVLSLL